MNIYKLFLLNKQEGIAYTIQIKRLQSLLQGDHNSAIGTASELYTTMVK